MAASDRRGDSPKSETLAPKIFRRHGDATDHPGRFASFFRRLEFWGKLSWPCRQDEEGSIRLPVSRGRPFIETSYSSTIT